MAQSAEAATPEALAAIARWAETEVAVPTANSKIYKDECMFSFRNARDDDGVYVNLKSFQCFSREYIPLDRQRDAAKGGQDGGQHLYLHVRWEKVLKDEFKTDADGDSVMDPTAAAAAAADVAAPADADTPMDGAGGDAGAGKDAAGGEVTKLAIGVEGGFQVEGDKYRWDEVSHWRTDDELSATFKYQVIQYSREFRNESRTKLVAAISGCLGLA